MKSTPTACCSCVKCETHAVAPPRPLRASSCWPSVDCQPYRLRNCTTGPSWRPLKSPQSRDGGGRARQSLYWSTIVSSLCTWRTRIRADASLCGKSRCTFATISSEGERGTVVATRRRCSSCAQRPAASSKSMSASCTTSQSLEIAMKSLRTGAHPPRHARGPRERQGVLSDAETRGLRGRTRSTWRRVAVAGRMCIGCGSPVRTAPAIGARTLQPVHPEAPLQRLNIHVKDLPVCIPKFLSTNDIGLPQWQLEDGAIALHVYIWVCLFPHALARQPAIRWAQKIEGGDCEGRR